MAELKPKDVLHWLDDNPRLHELMERYPEVWADAGDELVAALENGRAQTLQALAAKARADEELWRGRIRKNGNHSRVIQSALPHLIRCRMSLLALEKCLFAAATGKAAGKVRFSLFNGYIVQKLLFSRHLTRKPASLRWFKFWWPLVSQKRLLMPLVQQKGIYCFYTRELIDALAQQIGGRSCLEIAAGDGTLTRFLAAAGVDIRATDDCSWGHTIEYPELVERLEAKQALEKYQPRVAICSWPPPGNRFERDVFASRNLEIYIVVGSRYRFASGNWDAYANQTRFEVEHSRQLSRLVLPPELESLVLIFRRKTQSVPAGYQRVPECIND